MCIHCMRILRKVLKYQIIQLRKHIQQSKTYYNHSKQRKLYMKDYHFIYYQLNG